VLAASLAAVAAFLLIRLLDTPSGSPRPGAGAVTSPVAVASMSGAGSSEAPVAAPSPTGTAPLPPGASAEPTAEPAEQTPRPTPTPRPSVSLEPLDGTPSDELRMRLQTVITGKINPKSIESSQSGLFFAQNNVWRHTITVYDRAFRLVKTIKDSVVLSEWGYPAFPEKVRGGPVEAAFTPDGGRAYVTQRSMYGPGFPRPGPIVDDCSPSDDIDRGFVYEFDTETLERTRVIRVGSLPKDLIVTPDERYLLVTNWCSYDLSVVDLAAGKEVRRVPLGQYPRGVAVDPASKTAYVAVIITGDIAKVDLETWRVTWIRNVGSGPRDVLMSPDGRFLYVSLGEGRVVKLDRRTERVVDGVRSGAEPRSMALAADGRSLYVVHWASGTAAKIRTRDMKVIQTVDTGYHPIGITYDNATRQIWVSTYPGTIRVYRDE
jgi:YVTN family beta-propeller protein